MRNFTHYIVTNHADIGLNYVLPFSSNRDLQRRPQRMVKWGCVGPCLIAWGRNNNVPHAPLADDLFLPPEQMRNAHNSIGQWFKKRRLMNL